MKFDVSAGTRLATVLCIIAFFMIAVVSSDALTGKRLNSVKNNFRSGELKMQGVTAEQWAPAPAAVPDAAVPNAVSGGRPEIAAENKVLYLIVAAAAIGAFPANDDPARAGEDHGDY